MRTSLIATLIAALLTACGTSPPAVSAPSTVAPTKQERFYAGLTTAGVSSDYQTPEGVELVQTSCRLFGEIGVPATMKAHVAGGKKSKMDPEVLGRILGVGTGVYCPEHLDALEAWTR